MPLSVRNIEKIAVFVFGVVFLIAIIILTVWIPEPTPAQWFAFRLALALAAAGIGALLPGLMRLDIPLPLQGGIRAGGALALFSSVWFVNPATLGIDVQPPRDDASALISKFLALTDAGDHKAAYALYSKQTKERISEIAYVSMGKQVRDPLGSVTQRTLTGTSTPNEINGVKKPFVVQIFQGKFSTSKEVWAESISTIPEAGVWRMYAYTVGRCDRPYCQPISSLAP